VLSDVLHSLLSYLFIRGPLLCGIDGEDLEGYSRDFSIVSRPPHEAILKYTFLPFTIPYQFIRFSSLLLRAWLKVQQKKIITSFRSQH